MAEEDLVHHKETRAIIGAAMEVLNELGHGYHEKPYENALVVEFQLREIPFEQQAPYKLEYKGQQVSTFIPDLVAFDTIIIDTKGIPRITDHERGQMLNYLRVTGLKVGLILNFSKARLEGERLVL